MPGVGPCSGVSLGGDYKAKGSLPLNLSFGWLMRINELISENATGQIFTCLKEHTIFISSFTFSDNPFCLPLGFEWSVQRTEDKMMNLTQGPLDSFAKT